MVRIRVLNDIVPVKADFLLWSREPLARISLMTFLAHCHLAQILELDFQERRSAFVGAPDSKIGS